MSYGEEKRWIWVGDDIRPLMRSRRTRPVALDTETTGLDFFDEVLGVSLAWRTHSGDIKSAYLRAPTGQISLDAPLMSRGEIRISDVLREVYRNDIIYHSEAFDHRAMFRVSDLWPRKTHDTIHLATLHEYQFERNLRWLYSKYVPDGEVPDDYTNMKKKRGKLAKMPLEPTSLYARTDAINALELFEALHPRVVGEIVTDSYYESEREYAQIVMQLIREGLILNSRWCNARAKKFHGRMVEIENILHDQGLRDIGSNASVATYLFKILGLPDDITYATRVKTAGWPNGIPSVSVDVIDKLAPMNEGAAMIKEWRQLAKGLSSWILDLPVHASIDGKVHALLDPFGTISGRMAASHPNVQAIPMTSRGAAFGSMKGIFRGGINEVLWAIDYSQAETRLAAVEAREQRLMDLLNSGDDPYLQMAIDIWNHAERRNDAKHATLASIYGVGVYKFAETYDVSEDLAGNTLQGFRNAFPRVKAALSIHENVAKRNGRCVRAYTGRPRWFGEDEELYKAFNQKIQMTVAEMIKQAMITISREMPGIMRLQVHDSIAVSLPRRGYGDQLHRVKEIMEESVPEMYSDHVQFPVEAEKWQ